MATWTNTELIDQLIAEAEPLIAVAFGEVVLSMKNEGTLVALAELLASGQFELALQSVEAHAAKIASVVNRVYVNAGQETIDALGDALSVVVNFDQTNLRAVRLMAENRLDLIRGFTESQREATRQALMDGIARGLNPREQARAFRDSIGLTKKQVQWIENYRADLENLSPRALRRELRDGRFDSTVRSAINNESPLTKTQIDKMVGRYRDRWIKYRAETIARNESLAAVHQGADEAIQQAVDSGAVDETNATSEWQTALDERVRDPIIGSSTSHRTMHGQKKPFGVPFVSGAGNELRYPNDPLAPPEERFCRCRVGTRITI